MSLVLLVAGLTFAVNRAIPIEPVEWADGPEYKDECQVIVSVTLLAPEKLNKHCREIVRKDDRGAGITTAHTFYGCTNSLLGIISVSSTDTIKGATMDYTYLLGHEIRHVLDYHCRKEKK